MHEATEVPHADSLLGLRLALSCGRMLVRAWIATFVCNRHQTAELIGTGTRRIMYCVRCIATRHELRETLAHLAVYAVPRYLSRAEWCQGSDIARCGSYIQRLAMLAHLAWVRTDLPST